MYNWWHLFDIPRCEISTCQLKTNSSFHSRIIVSSFDSQPTLDYFAATRTNQRRPNQHVNCHDRGSQLTEELSKMATKRVSTSNISEATRHCCMLIGRETEQVLPAPCNKECHAARIKIRPEFFILMIPSSGRTLICQQMRPFPQTCQQNLEQYVENYHCHYRNPHFNPSMLPRNSWNEP